MNIAFTRTGERTYMTQAVRDDGVTLQVPSYDRTALLPHDIGHFVVERELGLRQGFWGCVAQGALFPGMTVVSGRQPPHAAARSQAIIREAGQQATHAEVLVGILLGVLHDDLEGSELAAQARVKAAWRPGKPERGLIDAAEVQRVCAALRDILRRWQSLAVGQSLVVWWPTPARKAGGTHGRAKR